MHQSLIYIWILHWMFLSFIQWVVSSNNKLSGSPFLSGIHFLQGWAATAKQKSQKEVYKMKSTLEGWVMTFINLLYFNTNVGNIVKIISKKEGWRPVKFLSSWGLVRLLNSLLKCKRVTQSSIMKKVLAPVPPVLLKK